MTRLPVTKQEKHKQGKLSTLGTLVDKPGSEPILRETFCFPQRRDETDGRERGEGEVQEVILPSFPFYFHTNLTKLLEDYKVNFPFRLEVGRSSILLSRLWIFSWILCQHSSIYSLNH